MAGSWQNWVNRVNNNKYLIMIMSKSHPLVYQNTCIHHHVLETGILWLSMNAHLNVYWMQINKWHKFLHFHAVSFVDKYIICNYCNCSHWHWNVQLMSLMHLHFMNKLSFSIPLLTASCCENIGLPAFIDLTDFSFNYFKCKRLQLFIICEMSTVYHTVYTCIYICRYFFPCMSSVEMSVSICAVRDSVLWVGHKKI